MDSWLRAYEAPPLDPIQNLYNMSAWRENGITTLRFSRKRVTGDNRDFQFSDTNCPYLVFPVMGGVFNAVNKRIRKHETTPIISDRRVCIRSCRPSIATTAPEQAVSTDPKQDSDVNTKTAESDDNQSKDASIGSTPQTTDSTESPKTKEVEDISEVISNSYRIQVKLPAIWRPGLASRHSNEFRTTAANLRQQLSAELNKNYPALSDIDVHDLTRVQANSNTVLASIDLRVKPDHSRDVETILSSALTAIISDEQIGNLKVDPKYLTIARKEGAV